MGVVLLETKDQYDAAIKGEKVFVDFYADWCGPCRMIAPAIDKMSGEDEFAGIKFYKVNVDNNSEASEEAGIQAMPTFHLFKNGQKVGEVVGANEDKIRQELKKLV